MAKEDRAARQAARQAEQAATKVHKLGFGNGALTEHPDGTMSYRKTGEMTQTFRVRVADVTGFLVTKDGKMMERTFHVLGAGTELARVSVNHGTSEKIEEVFRKHPDFSQGQAVEVVGAPVATMADEIRKLADLKEQGLLTEEEFSAAKATLLQKG